MPFKVNQDRRHRIPKQRHRVTNWAAYDAGLRARGSLTLWFSEEAIAAWNAEARTTRGGQPRYSALAITTALALRAVFRLALRQTEGLIGSILSLLGLDLAVPDHSTLSRRAETLEVPRPRHGCEPVHLLVDNTGLKLCGPGGWLVEKHGTKTRCGWRKLHLATDADTGRIVASALTDKDADDGSQTGPLLDRIDGPVASFTADGAFDRDDVYAEVAARHPGRPSSCRRARARCRATRPRPRRRSATASAMHRRARPHGLAEGVGVWLARSGGVRYLAMERVIGDGLRFQTTTAGDRGGKRGRGAEPHAEPGRPGVCASQTRTR
jgi:hypothetical protein